MQRLRLTDDSYAVDPTRPEELRFRPSRARTEQVSLEPEGEEKRHIASSRLSGGPVGREIVQPVSRRSINPVVVQNVEVEPKQPSFDDIMNIPGAMMMPASRKGGATKDSNLAGFRKVTSAGQVKRSAPAGAQRAATRKGLDPVARSVVSQGATVEPIAPKKVEQETVPQPQPEAEDPEEMNLEDLEAELDAFMADNRATDLTTIVFPTTFNPEAAQAASEGQTFTFGGEKPSDAEVDLPTNDAPEFNEAFSEVDLDVNSNFDSFFEQVFGFAPSVDNGAVNFSSSHVAAGVEHQAPPVMTEEGVSFFETFPPAFEAALPDVDMLDPSDCEQVPESSQEAIPELGSLPEVEQHVASEAYVVDLSALFASTGVNFAKSFDQGFAANDDHVAATEQSWSHFKATGGTLDRFREYPECWLPNLLGLAHNGVVDVFWNGEKQGIFFDTELKVILRVINTEIEMTDAEPLEEDSQPFNGVWVNFAYEDALMRRVPMSDSEF